MNQPEFFTTHDLQLLKQWAGEAYTGSGYHKQIGQELLEGPWTKTKYWTEEVAKQCELDSDIRRLWKNQGMKFSEYTWGKIRDESVFTKEIYFTVGINNGGDNGPYLHIKIDYQFENPKELSESKIERCKQLIRPGNGDVFYEATVSLDSLENYDWDRLIRETVHFINEFKNSYYSIISDVEGVNPRYFTRLCWNKHAWKYPSGREGKSSSKDSFEGLTGIGMEEWLFAEDLQVNGFQYGFLQGVNQSPPSSEIFDADLYTVEDTDEGKQVYWVCSIKNIEAISKEEAYRIQKETGFENEVHENLYNIPSPERLETEVSSYVDDNFLNVKFKLSDIEYPESVDPIEVDLDISRYKRYRLYHGSLFHKVTQYKPIDQSGFDVLGDTSGSRSRNRTSFGSRSPGSYEIQHIHDEISRRVETYLKGIKQPEEKVNYEVPLGRYKAVDLVYEKAKEITFYEIKTHPKLIFCIREGIGQLLEYGYYNRPEHDKEVNLILVSPHRATKELKWYMQKLRSMSEFNIFYQQYDEESKELNKKV